MYSRRLQRFFSIEIDFFYPTLNLMTSLFLPVNRDGVISVNKDSGQFTDEYLPDQRSHLYGITAVYPYCPAGKPTRSGCSFGSAGERAGLVSHYPWPRHWLLIVTLPPVRATLS